MNPKNGQSHQGQNGDDAQSVEVMPPLEIDEEQDILDAAKDANLAVIPPTTIKSLKEFGIEAEQIGLTSVAKGKLIMTMTGLQEVENMVLDVMRKTKSGRTRLQAAAVYAMLAKASRDCATAVNAQGLEVPEKEEKRKPRHFAILSAPVKKTA